MSYTAHRTLYAPLGQLEEALLTLQEEFSDDDDDYMNDLYSEEKRNDNKDEEYWPLYGNY